MNQIINQRLSSFIAGKKLSVNSFSKLIGIPQGTLNQQANGTVRVSVDTLAAVALAFPDADMRWILTGESSQSDTKKDVRNNYADSRLTDVSTLFNIIHKLQDENAALIALLGDRQVNDICTILNK